MSGGIAPSKSTIYVGNLVFSLTNNDLHKIFEKYGKVVKVTIVKDKETHKSSGVAFIQYLERECAQNAVQALNKSEMFGRVIKVSIAKDNGRATEFIKRKFYKDKSRCYECGEAGHLSYKCPKNILGARDPPKKKKKKRNYSSDEDSNECHSENECETGVDLKEESLSSAILYQQKLINSSLDRSSSSKSEHKRYKKDSYFSDEEELEAE